MGYTERMTERLGIIAPAHIAYTDGTAAATATSGTADMKNARRALAVIIGNGTGTAGITIQAGRVTYGTRSDGIYTSGGVPTWATLSGGTATTGATAKVTQGEMKTIEIIAEHLPSGARYLRALVANGTANTFSTLVFITDIEREAPLSNGSITSSMVV